MSPLAPPLRSGPTAEGGQGQTAPVEVAVLGMLTTDELQVLEYLPTRLSFDEIGQRVLAPRDSVKSLAIAVYRKLGVISRAEAVHQAQEMGLLSADH